jgi:hypothetical protein
MVTPTNGVIIDTKVIGNSDGLSLLFRLEAVEARLNTLVSTHTLESCLATLFRVFVLDTWSRRV